MSDSEICVNWLSAWERTRLIWNLRNSALQDFGKTIKTSFPKIVLSLLEFRLQKRCLSSQIDLLNTQSTRIFGDATFSRLVSPFLSWTVNCVLAFFSLTSHQPLQRPLAPSAASQDHTFHFQRKQTRLIYTAAATSLCVVLICWRINGWQAKKKGGMIIRLNVGVWLPLGVLPKKSWQRPASH